MTLIKFWDPVVRIAHGVFVGAFVTNYFFLESGDWHDWVGYAAFAAVLIRFTWGFVAPYPQARWADFFPTPQRLKHHFKHLWGQHALHRLGHSPIGALVMILMLFCVTLLFISGFMFKEIDAFWGNETLENIHEWTGNILASLAGLHVLAAFAESWRLKDNLPLSMITGKRKPISQSLQANDLMKP